LRCLIILLAKTVTTGWFVLDAGYWDRCLPRTVGRRPLPSPRARSLLTIFGLGTVSATWAGVCGARRRSNVPHTRGRAASVSACGCRRRVIIDVGDDGNGNVPATVEADCRLPQRECCRPLVLNDHGDGSFARLLYSGRKWRGFPPRDVVPATEPVSGEGGKKKSRIYLVPLKRSAVTTEAGRPRRSGRKERRRARGRRKTFVLPMTGSKSYREKLFVHTDERPCRRFYT